jgi:hypothetical protein
VINLYAGFDERESIGWHVFVDSVMAHASMPLAIHALGSKQMPVGSTAFSYSRFLVPWLMRYSGHAIFADASDMLMLADVAELDALFDDQYAVQVVKHAPYKTRHPIKFRGTSMQCPNRDYARKQWASVMIMNCEHAYWRGFTPESLALRAGVRPLQFDSLADEEIGALPDRFNRIVDEGQPVEGAALLHFTAGIPCFPAYRDTPGADLWRAQYARMTELA